MIVCPHCGWDNPSEAAFCTNCGRGLARARASRVASLEESVGDVRPEARQRFKALDAAGRTARDHEMPLLRATPVPAEVPVPPAAGAPGFEGGPGDLPVLRPAPSATLPPATAPDPEVAPIPPLRPAPAGRDATATLIDFRMPAGFAAELAQSTLDSAPPPDPDDAPAEPGPGDSVDSEEFPGLEVPSTGPATAEPIGVGEMGLVPRPSTPPAAVAEILPLAALDPSSPLRVARIIEMGDAPAEADDFEIPSQDDPSLPGGAGRASLDGLEPDLPAEGDAAAAVPSAPAPAPTAPVGPVDLASLDEVDLDGRLDDPEGDFMDISVNEMADFDPLEPPAPDPDADAELFRSGDIEQVRPEAARAAPPPLREMDVRFILRPLSNNVADAQLVTVGERGLTIGRTDAELLLGDDPYLSPRHVHLTVENDTLFAEDLHSLNGTWIRVRSQVELRLGDTFRVGHQILRLDAVPPRPVSPVHHDGTRRMGAARTGTALTLTQLCDDGQPRNVYVLTDQGARIGRHIADIVFTDDTFMSGTHAVVLPRHDRAVLRDLSSRNGTWVRMQGRRVLGAGDALMIGQTVWRVSRPV